MRLPRLILNPSIRPWLLLWQLERKENARLRRELREWQGKLLQKVNVTPLFTPPPKPVPSQHTPPVGLAAKRLHLASAQGQNATPSAEDILEAAAKAKSNGHQ